MRECRMAAAQVPAVSSAACFPGKGGTVDECQLTIKWLDKVPLRCCGCCGWLRRHAASARAGHQRVAHSAPPGHSGSAGS